jgi:uncharacterized membrane protein
MKVHVGYLTVGFLSLALPLAAQTASSSSASSPAPPVIQSPQTPAVRTQGFSGGGVLEAARQPISNTANAIPQSSLSFTFSFGLVDFPRSNSNVATGINNRGTIVGGYNDANLEAVVPGDSAFLLSGNGFQSFTFPGAVQTSAYASNESGEIIGAFSDTGADLHGFTRVGSTYTEFDCPAGTTLPYAINDSGDIVGYCANSNAGFLLKDGVYTTIAVPGAAATWAEGINNAEVIVGWYTNCNSCPFQGFMYNGGTYTTIDYPGAANTYLAGINDSGLIVGGYGTPVTIGSTEYVWPHGFVYSAGTFSSFDAPFGAVAVTEPFAVNNRGEIVGGYVDSAGMTYGFYLKIIPWRSH